MVCLYALYGALANRRWNGLPSDVKRELRAAAGGKPETKPAPAATRRVTA